MLPVNEDLISGGKENICRQYWDLGFPEKVLSNLPETIKLPK